MRNNFKWSKIQEVLGDNGVYNVTDSVINNYFNSFIEQNFILEYEKIVKKGIERFARF